MKKIVALILVLLAFSSICVFAEGNETDKPITFLDYTFGDSFKNIRNQTRLFCIDFLYTNINSRVVSDALYDFGERDDFAQNRKIPSCFFARTSETNKVAGYEVGTVLWFVYPFKDGIFCSEENEAVFYAGVYEFHSWDDLPAIKEDIKGKLTVLYGDPYYTGDSLNSIMGDMPLKENLMHGYNDDNAKFKPEYAVWKSSANDVYAVLSFWYDTNIKEYRLKLAYVSDLADVHFEKMANLGVFGDDLSVSVSDDMGGL